MTDKTRVLSVIFTFSFDNKKNMSVVRNREKIGIGQFEKDRSGPTRCITTLLEMTYTNAERASTWHNQDTTCTMHFFALYRVTVSIYLNSPTSNFLVCYRFWLALITLDLVIIEVKAKNKNKNFGFVFFLLWIFHQELICALHQP